MNLFNIVPEKLFSVLASPLKEYYSDILFLIYDQYMLTSFSIEREVIIDIISDYIEGRMDNTTFSTGLDDEIWEESLQDASGIRDRASFILRKLELTGWITVETYSNYQQYINLNDYSIRILDALDKVRKNYRAEYQGYVYATYTLLYSEEANRQSNIALEKAYEQTEQLISGLKSLNHNIKRYTEKVFQQKRPQEILKLHFEEYKSEIIDKSYHRLKTSDNVSRYRPKITGRISRWYNDDKWVLAVAAEEVKRDKFRELDDAKRDIYRKLDFIRQSYENMDGLLDEIDRRNGQYADASYMQLRYMLNSSRNVEGQILEIMKYVSKLLTVGKAGRWDYLDDEAGRLFSFYTQNFIDAESIYKPHEAARVHQAVELDDFGLSEQKKKESVQKIREKLQNRMTREKINEYILHKLGEKDSIKAHELGIEAIDDFLKLIYAAVYSRSKLVDYSVDFQGEYVESGQESYRYKDVEIKSKGRKRVQHEPSTEIRSFRAKREGRIREDSEQIALGNLLDQKE